MILSLPASYWPCGIFPPRIINDNAPFFSLPQLPLRYDMILIIVRALFISSWVTFGLSLDVLTGFDSGVHWIGMAQVTATCLIYCSLLLCF